MLRWQSIVFVACLLCFSPLFSKGLYITGHIPISKMSLLCVLDCMFNPLSQLSEVKFNCKLLFSFYSVHLWVVALCARQIRFCLGVKGKCYSLTIITLSSDRKEKIRELCFYGNTEKSQGFCYCCVHFVPNFVLVARWLPGSEWRGKGLVSSWNPLTAGNLSSKVQVHWPLQG